MTGRSFLLTIPRIYFFQFLSSFSATDQIECSCTVQQSQNISLFILFSTAADQRSNYSFIFYLSIFFFLWEKHPSSHIYPCKLIQQVTDKTRDKLKPSISYHHQVHTKRSCSRENNKCLGYIHRYIPHNHQKNFPMKDAQRHITLLVKSILFSA